MNILKPFIKDWLPPVILRKTREMHRNRIRFMGNYSTWEEASGLCTGYDTELILAKVLESTLKVKGGEVSFERDSVLFDEIEYSWPVTAAMLWVAAINCGNLHVLDYGGSLGSSYFQNIKFTSRLKNVTWSVIEQKKFVDAGREYISDKNLKFYNRIEDCLQVITPNVVLLSSVLQYLPKPVEVLKSIASYEIPTIIIDRTPFLKKSSETYITIQQVPENICPASYPCWFFSGQEFISTMMKMEYQLVERFDALDKLADEACWQGLIFQKKT